MARIPKQVAETNLSRVLEAEGLRRIRQGKVRDTHELPSYPELLLPIATDRLSIFDIVLNVLVPFKGEVLVALTIFWNRLLSDIKTDLVAFGKDINKYLPLTLRGSPEVLKRGLVVSSHQIVPIEGIGRGFLAGSGYRDYVETGKVCGHKLPPGLHDGSRLPESMFTPSTKAEDDHDQNIDAQGVIDTYGERIRDLTLGLYMRAAEFAWSRGIIIADTKFEFSTDFVLCDEKLTPDSSRFWDIRQWEEAAAEKRAPCGYDKEPVRQWGLTFKTPFGVSFNRLRPTDPAHVAWVHGLEIPQEVVDSTTARYLEVFKRLTGQSLQEFQREVMGIKA